MGFVFGNGRALWFYAVFSMPHELPRHMYYKGSIKSILKLNLSNLFKWEQILLGINWDPLPGYLEP